MSKPTKTPQELRAQAAKPASLSGESQAKGAAEKQTAAAPLQAKKEELEKPHPEFTHLAQPVEPEKQQPEAKPVSVDSSKFDSVPRKMHKFL